MGVRKAFRENYRATLPFLQPIVEFMNAVGRVLNNVKVVVGSEPKATVTPAGMRFVIPVGGDGGGDGGGLENSSFVATAREGEDSDSSSGSESGSGGRIEVKMLGGSVQGLFGSLQTFPTTYWTPDGNAPTLFDDYDEDTDDVVAASASEKIHDGDWFWLEYDPAAEDGERWSVEHGAEVPASRSVTVGSQVRYFACVPLFFVRLSQPDAGVVQNHTGGVYVPTLANVVQVQDTVDGGDDESSDSSSGSGGA